jgi:hypothetical protein
MAQEVLDNLHTFLSTGFLEKEILKKMEIEWSKLHEPFLQEGKRDIFFQFENGIKGHWYTYTQEQNVILWLESSKRQIVYEGGRLKVMYCVKRT